MGSAKSRTADMAEGMQIPKKPFLSGKPETPKAQGKKRRGPEEPPGERVAVYLPPELVTRLRVHAAQSRSSLSDVVTKAVEKMFPEV